MNAKNVILLCFMLFVLHADDISEIDLGEITTTANKTSSLISQSPGNIDILKDIDIKKTPNAKFSDTLRGLNGVSTPKGRGLETFDSVTIRGITGGTNILVDGVSLNDMNNNTKMLTAMSAFDLQRVEIIRGPLSNIYGSGALGGVVNFITQMYDKPTMKANLGYGNPMQEHNAPQNLVRGFVSLGNSYFDQQFKIKASYGFSTSKGYSADNAWSSTNNSGVVGYKPTLSSTGVQRYIVGDMGRQAFGTHDFRLRGMLYVSDNGELDMIFNYSNYNYKHIDQQTFLSKNGTPYYGESNNNNGSVGNIPYAYVGGMGVENYDQFIETVKYKHYFDSGVLEFDVSRIDGFDKYNAPNSDATPFSGSAKQTYTRHQKTALDLFYDMQINKTFSLLVGTDYKLSSMDIKDTNVVSWQNLNSQKLSFVGKSGGDSHFIGAFGDLKIKFFNEKIITSIGTRVDYWIGSDYYKIDSTNSNLPTRGNKKFAISPKLAINYIPTTKTILKASISQAFRVPTLNQMFSNYILNDGTKILGNPNLKPENATSFDIGIEQKIFKNPIKIFYFYTHLDNAIYNDQTIGYQNAGSARIQGIEVSYKENIIRDLSANIAYTWSDSKMLKNTTNQNSVGKKLPYVPTHKAYGELYYEYNHLYSQDSKIYGSIGLEFASKTYSYADNSDTIKKVYGAYDSYFVTDLRLGMYLNKDFSVNFDVTNLFNYKYYSYYKAAGRAFFLSFNYDI